jgi:hypothetical protein
VLGVTIHKWRPSAVPDRGECERCGLAYYWDGRLHTYSRNGVSVEAEPAAAPPCGPASQESPPPVAAQHVDG